MACPGAFLDLLALCFILRAGLLDLIARYSLRDLPS